MAIDYVGMDVHVNFGDSRSNGSLDIRGAGFVSNEGTLRSLSQYYFSILNKGKPTGETNRS